MNKLNYQPTDEYRKWWDENRAKLSGHSIYTKGAVIWQAAIAAQEPNKELVEALQELCDLVRLEVADGEHTTEFTRGIAALRAAGVEAA